MVVMLTMIAMWCGNPLSKQIYAGITRDDVMSVSKVQACRTAMLTCLTSGALGIQTDAQIKACAAAQTLQ